MAGVATCSGGIRQLPTGPNSTEKAIRYIRTRFCRGFFGSITVKIEDGHVTHVREERNYLGSQIPQPEIQESPDV